MENASKALIIAGAILLAIAIIGIGMYVFSSASSQVGDANLSAEELEIFNGPFIRYEGSQKGTNVKSLLRAIRSHNGASDYDITSVSATYKKAGATTETKTESSDSTPVNTAISTIITDLPDNGTYTVTFTFGGEGGRINGVTIK